MSGSDGHSEFLNKVIQLVSDPKTRLGAGPALLVYVGYRSGVVQRYKNFLVSPELGQMLEGFEDRQELQGVDRENSLLGRPGP